MTTPIISICLITYNHEKYIAQAIESILAQKVNVSTEFIIAEDCSKDKTREIVEKYVLENPHIKLILQKTNVGPARNFIDLITSATGKYIAYIEGDDYWTDPLKLQKQIEFLESNLDFSICFHPVRVVDENGKGLYISNKNQKEISSFEDLAQENYIHTPSCLFRSFLKEGLPSWFDKVRIGDWYLFLLAAQKGKIKFFDEVMATYRIHSGGVYSSSNEVNRLISLLEVAEHGINHFKPLGEKQFEAHLSKSGAYLCFLYFEQAEYKEFRKYYKKIQNIKSLSYRTSISLLIRNYLSYFPKVASFYKNRGIN